jgi:hypothetical protein
MGAGEMIENCNRLRVGKNSRQIPRLFGANRIDLTAHVLVKRRFKSEVQHLEVFQ